MAQNNDTSNSQEERRLYFCANCKHLFNGKNDAAVIECPNCNTPLTKTIIKSDDWKGFSAEKRKAIARELLSGKYNDDSSYKENRQLPNITENNITRQKINGETTSTTKKISYKIINAIVGALCIAILIASTMMFARSRKKESEISSLKIDNKNLNNKITDLSNNVSELENDKEKLQNTNTKLLAENDELKNGAASLIVDIRNAHDDKDWSGTIKLAKKLHKKYNGSAEDVEGQKLANDAKAKLKAEKKAAEEKEKKGYNTGITYNQLARNPEKYEGEKIKFSGKVVQVIENDDESETEIRLAVNGDYDSIILVGYENDIVSSRILEDDTITFYGTSVGTISYDSTLGGKITIPAAIANKIDQ